MSIRVGSAVGEGSSFMRPLKWVGSDPLPRGDPLPFRKLIHVGQCAIAIAISGDSVATDRSIYLVQDRLIVDMDDAAPKLISDALRPGQVGREDRCGEAVLRVVLQSDASFRVTKGWAGSHGPKDLLVERCHSRGHSRQARGRKKKALPGAARHTLCAPGSR